MPGRLHRPFRFSVPLAVGVAFAAVFAAAPASSLATPAGPDHAALFTPDRVVVGYDPLHDVADAILRLGGELLDTEPVLAFHVVRVQDPESFIGKIRSEAGVRYAQREGVLVLEDTPNDPMFGSQWGLRSIRAPAAWDTEKGDSSVVVAVIDTGVSQRHIDLLLNLWRNSDEIPKNGIDDDGNGFVDDWTGYDFAGNDGDPDDTDGGSHGTHVAGIVGAVRDDYTGVVGVAQVSIMGLKIFGGGNFNTNAAKALRYAADNGARVATMSWYTSPCTCIDEALAYAWGKGVLLTKSAGNQYGGGVTYPGTRPETIAVSALREGDVLASFSSVGAKVEVSAPGQSVLSTVPSKSIGPSVVGLKDGYASFSGTSMAAPHAAGLAGLIFSKNPALTNAQVRALLGSTARDLGAPGRDIQYGFGVIDAEAAIKAA